MSIKDLFKKTNKIFDASSEKIEQDVESVKFMSEKTINNNIFIPEADYSKPENFARFGLAENYYKEAISLIRDTYPYDGSEKELYEWLNKLTYIEKYIFDNLYPKTTGYINLNKNISPNPASVATADGLSYWNMNGQYINMLSGPNMVVADSHKFGNLYEPANKRNGNFDLTPNSGNTVEFWLKLENKGLTDTKIFCIFDLWNGKPITDIAYTRFTIDISPAQNKLYVTYRVGTGGITRKELSITDIDVKNWNHYAVTVKNSQTSIDLELYLNGNRYSTIPNGTLITGNPIVYNYGIKARVGKYLASPLTANGSSDPNYGLLFGSVDEFRFWKTVRTEKEINRFIFDRVYGGTNTDDSNVDLGAYYRFNEGITNSTQRDQVILDYSGRLTNAVVALYDSSCRSTSSAAEESGLFKSREPKDPIIYKESAVVVELLDNLTLLGSTWDGSNPNSIYRSLPEWIVEEDEERSGSELKNLCQIIATYFDKLYLQIKALPATTYGDYLSDGSKQLPFQKSILEANGVIGNDIFIDSSVLEQFKSRDEKLLFGDSVENIKNLIYKNIYNNLSYIYKTKGSEKSFRNMLRCFGIDDELIKLNLYANNTTYELADSRRETTLRKKILNLSNVNSFNCTLVNTKTSVSETSWVGPTSTGTSVIKKHLIPFTHEVSVVFPSKAASDEESFLAPEGTRISIFGAKSVNNISTDNDYTIKPNSLFNFSVFLVKNSKYDLGGYFEFVTKDEVLRSEYFSELYTDQKWTFALRLKTPEINYSKLRADSTAFDNLSGDYYVELYAVSTAGDTTTDSFLLKTRNLTKAEVESLHNEYKRFYAGANRTDLIGAVIDQTDLYFIRSSFRFDYLTNSEVESHCKDLASIGLQNPQSRPYIASKELISRPELLVFEVGVEDLKKVDGAGEATLYDIKSSVAQMTNTSLLTQNTNSKYPHKLIGGQANNSEIVKKYYSLSAKNELPENLFSLATINISGDTDTAFTKATLPSSLFLAFEKSMYRTISEEMLGVFSSIQQFNTIIGDPINKYRQEYKGLSYLRQQFFNNVKNAPNLEHYIEFYKWIDNSISSFVSGLTPAGIDSSRDILTTIESHIFERPKYDYKLPLFEERKIPTAQIKGIKELKYSWKTGFYGGDLWLKERASRYDETIFPGLSDLTRKSRQGIIDSITNETDAKPATYYSHRLARTIDILGNNVNLISDTINPFTLAKRGAVQAGSRENNPKFLAESDQITSNLCRNPLFGPNSDILVTRNTYKTIIASRFSSPGSFGETNRGRLDPVSESFSIYSTINERNRSVRRVHNKKLAASYDKDTNPDTIHKINKNSILYGDKLLLDNWFLQNEIPHAERYAKPILNLNYFNNWFAKSNTCVVFYDDYRRDATKNTGVVTAIIKCEEVKEPPVEWNVPLVTILNKDLNGTIQNILVNSDYSNLLDRYANEKIINRHQIYDINSDIAPFDSIYNLYKDFIKIKEGVRIEKIKYEERILPRKEKVGLRETRARTAYFESYEDRRKNIASINTVWDLDFSARKRAIGAECNKDNAALILRQTTDLASQAGNTVVLRVDVLCPSLVTFQWQKQAGLPPTFQDIPGKTSSVYTINNFNFLDAGVYRLAITKNGTTTYSNIITITFQL